MSELGLIVAVDEVEDTESTVAVDATEALDAMRADEVGGPMAFALALRFAMDFDFAGDIVPIDVLGRLGWAFSRFAAAILSRRADLAPLARLLVD